MQKVGWALAQKAGNLVLGIEGRMLSTEGAGLAGRVLGTGASGKGAGLTGAPTMVQ